jgi:hypothetical protein
LSDGYIIVGYRNGPSGWTKGDLWLLKTNLNGDTIWTKTYGGIGEDYGISIRKTIDNGFIISGTKSRNATSGKDVWLLKTNSLGDTQWTRTYGGSMEDVGYGVNICYDSGYVITGYINGTGPWTAGDLWLLKTNWSGDTLWTKIYGGTGEDYGFDICDMNNVGYIIAGMRNNNVWFLRTNRNGDTTGTCIFGGAGTESALSLCKTQTNDFIAAGWTNSFGSGNADVYVIKFSPISGIEEESRLPNTGHSIPTVINAPLSFWLNNKYLVYDITGKKVTHDNIKQGIYFVIVEGKNRGKIIKID